MLKLSIVLLILLIVYAIDCKKLRNIEEMTTEHENRLRLHQFISSNQVLWIAHISSKISQMYI